MVSMSSKYGTHAAASRRSYQHSGVQEHQMQNACGGMVGPYLSIIKAYRMSVSSQREWEYDITHL